MRHHDVSDFNLAKLRPILIALQLAQESGLKRVRVQTDFKLLKNARESIESIRKHHLEKQNGARSTNSETGRKILKLMDEMEVIIEYRSFYEDSGNTVLRLIKESMKKTHGEQSRMGASDWTITPNGVLPLEGRVVPTVYAVGRLHREGTVGAFAYQWVHESIDHLEMKPRSIGSHLRKSVLPITLFRSQMIAIYNAINEARSLNIPEIQLMTDSLQFIKYFRVNWKRRDGEAVPNESLYNNIKMLTETTKVHFVGVHFSKEDKWMSEAYQMTNSYLLKPEKK